MDRKSQVINQLLSYIREKRLQPGKNLPSERKMAEAFGVSRNTLREVIRMLENKGYVEVRAGSGCYLRAVPDRNLNPEMLLTPNPVTDLAAQLEACYLFFPEVASLAAEELNEEDLQELEKTIVDLSQAVIGRDHVGFVKSDRIFRRLIIASLKNPVLDRMNAQYELDSEGLDRSFGQFPEKEISRLFAGYVRALEAIRSRNRDRIRSILKYNLLLLSFLLMTYADIRFSPRMATLLKEFSLDVNGD